MGTNASIFSQRLQLKNKLLVYILMQQVRLDKAEDLTPRSSRYKFLIVKKKILRNYQKNFTVVSPADQSTAVMYPEMPM